MKLLSFGLLLISLYSCTTLYKPGMVHSPMLQSKGEVETTVAAGISGTGMINAQAAYAVSNHWALMTDIMYHPRTHNLSDRSKEHLRMLSGSGGIGYFRKKTTSRNLFQIYAGIGTGHTSDIITGADPIPDVRADYAHIFIQPGISYKNDNVSFGGDIRFNAVNVYHIEAYLYEKFGWWNTEFIFKPDTTLQFAIAEPVFNMTLGKKFKFFFQTGLTIPIWKAPSYFAVCRSSVLLVPLFRIGFGIRFSLEKKEK